MIRKPFGATGIEVSAIGQGTWDIPESGPRAREAIRAIQRGVELGMTHLDTAEMYGSGRAEELLGEAIRGFPREKLFIASKVLPSNASYAGTIAAARRSIERIGCEYLDLYMLHWPGEHPLEETMRAFDGLLSEGAIRFAGVSNFDTGEMRQATSFLRGAPLACNQVLYNLCERGVEHELLPSAARLGIAIVAYTPFARGKFLRSRAARETIDRIARKHAATRHQVALAFLLRHSNVFAIPKAANAEHAEENARAADLLLDGDDVAAVDAVFPLPAPGPLATL
ncbi:MAG: aldo/keto reductase [Candidatus Eremiobacteraeota bacterium]|nr:aldo/keto reductase [Candidatus Eremiobacteraeota bacterium]